QKVAASLTKTAVAVDPFMAKLGTDGSRAGDAGMARIVAANKSATNSMADSATKTGKAIGEMVSHFKGLAAAAGIAGGAFALLRAGLAGTPERPLIRFVF